MDTADLTRYMAEQGIDAEIIFLEEMTPTVETAAEAVGVRPQQIVKSLLFLLKGAEGELRPLLVVANGFSRVDYKKLAAYLDVSRRQVRIARPEQVAAITGYHVGTVPPFGHRQPLFTLVDEGVMREEEVYAGGGAINALVRLETAELQRALSAEIVPLTE